MTEGQLLLAPKVVGRGSEHTSLCASPFLRAVKKFGSSEIDLDTSGARINISTISIGNLYIIVDISASAVLPSKCLLSSKDDSMLIVVFSFAEAFSKFLLVIWPVVPPAPTTGLSWPNLDEHLEHTRLMDRQRCIVEAAAAAVSSDVRTSPPPLRVCLARQGQPLACCCGEA
uniref:Uncharacterized protein n=1 Tax=Romanomermis culicivorax TaxID=13658 RepID=A0A915JT22_ROMCU